MTFKVLVLYRDGFQVRTPFYMNVNDNDLVFSDTTHAGCNAKLVKAFDVTKTEYFVSETVDTIVSSTNGVIPVTSKSYYALLDQTGTSAPIATVMNGAERDFLGNIVWARTGAAVYRGTLTGAFSINGTFICPVVQNDGLIATNVSNTSADYIEVHATADVKLTSAHIEIKVFYNSLT